MSHDENQSIHIHHVKKRNRSESPLSGPSALAELDVSVTHSTDQSRGDDGYPQPLLPRLCLYVSLDQDVFVRQLQSKSRKLSQSSSSSPAARSPQPVKGAGS